MNTQPWFQLEYRDNSFKKYVVQIDEPRTTRAGTEVLVHICHNTVPKFSFSILFMERFLRKNFPEGTFDKSKIGTSDHSALIENIVRDTIFDRKVEDLNDKKITIQIDSDYSRNIFQDENGLLKYKRNPEIVAKENRFARETVLRELYMIYSERGPSPRYRIVKECHFYVSAIQRAIEALKDRKFIDSDASHNISLTHSGFSFIEDNFLLSPFRGEIFMIGACEEEIFKLKEKVYEPVVGELGYKLKFQEQSEPRNTIHEDIWERIEYSKIILCDLTFQKPNCFIEYGYALAKGKHIILCVEENEGRNKDGLMKMPFDTLPQKYSFWRREWLSNDKYSNELMGYHDTILDRIKEKLNIINAISSI